MKLHRCIFWLAAFLAIAAARAEDGRLAALFTNTSRTVTAAPRRPSIIFIQWHDLAAGDLSCYGQTNYQTPNLDRLAAGGVRFTEYTGGGDSPETLARLLAGQAGPPATGAANLARALKQNGYHTGLIGEWPFDRTPWLHGFDEFAGFFTDGEARNYFADFLWRYPHVIFDESNRVSRVLLDRETLYYNTEGKKGQYLPDLLVKAMLNFARLNVPDAANRHRPFFLWVNLPAPRSAAADREDFPVPSDAPFTGEPWPQAAKNRAALITRLDGGIGRLFEQLDKIGMTNNIVVCFSSSCAPAPFANTNLSFLLPKGDFRGTNNAAPPRLPLILHWPAKIPGGQVCDQACTPADFAPTALDLAYVKATNFTGHSLLPAIQAGGKQGEKP